MTEYVLNKSALGPSLPPRPSPHRAEPSSYAHNCLQSQCKYSQGMSNTAGGKHFQPYLKTRFSAKMSMVSTLILNGNSKEDSTPKEKYVEIQVLVSSNSMATDPQQQRTLVLVAKLFVAWFRLLLLFWPWCSSRNRRAFCDMIQKWCSGGQRKGPRPNAGAISKRFPYSEEGQHFHTHAFKFPVMPESEHSPEMSGQLSLKASKWN